MPSSHQRAPAGPRPRGQRRARAGEPVAAGTRSLVAPRPDGRRGQALVEFALTLPFLLVLFLFALDVGRLFFVYVGV
jgi:hypothetical protein